MAVVKQNSVNLEVTLNATGFAVGGGTTSKTLTVEDTAVVNQDLTTDKTGVVFGSVQLGGAAATVNEFSTDGTLAGNSDTAVPTEQAVKTYVGSAVSGATLATSVITADQTAAIWKRYVCNKAATACEVTLPTTFAVGDQIAIVGMGATGWKLISGAGTTVQFGAVSTKTAGYISSINQFDAIHIIGSVANSVWTVIDSIGNMTVEIS